MGACIRYACYFLKGVVIFSHKYSLEKIIAVVCALLFCMGIVLYIDCARTHAHITSMLHMQEMYQQQLQILNESLQNGDEDILEGLTSEIVQEQEIPIVAPDEFVLVNRDSSYLKKNLKNFVSTQKLLKNGQKLAEIYSAEEYAFITAEDASIKKNKKNKNKKSSTKKQATPSSQLRRLGQQARRAAGKMAHKDFDFVWPIDLKKFWISSLFGPRKRPNGRPGFHYGIDMAAMKGTPVKAAASGKVLQAQYAPGYGNNIIINHSKHYRTRYAHLHSIKVKPGQWIRAGQVIGTVGDTGFVRKSGKYATHLHFEIHENGKQVNPLRYLFH